MVVCPADDFSCPYYKEGECTIENPREECDEFAYYDEEEGFYEDDSEVGFDPYLGCYTDDC